MESFYNMHYAFLELDLQKQTIKQIFDANY